MHGPMNIKSIHVITPREMDMVARKVRVRSLEESIINLSQSDHNLSESAVTSFCVGIFFSHIGRIMRYIRKYPIHNSKARCCQTLPHARITTIIFYKIVIFAPGSLY